MRATRHRYGGHHWQVADLWLPDGGADAPLPVVVLIHGGYWRSQYTKALMNRLARAVVAQGWAAWNIEYRRVGPLGGGGYPSTLDDVGAAIDSLAGAEQVDLDRVVTCGHSSGGQLALWAAGTRQPRPAGVVRPRAAIALAGVVDLELAAALDLGGGAVERFLGGPPSAYPDRYAAASPAARLPLGVPQVLIHGLADDVVPPSMSEAYDLAARGSGDEVVYEPLAGLDHRDVIDPTTSAWPRIGAHLERLFARSPGGEPKLDR